ncbi:MAG: hybrid sensor histidine kinase/response regulator [Deltaproteobacteria bacterium]|nr:hybrid sensor histidine kinase/response regulator [Deltaproteobacteria bacterium]
MKRAISLLVADDEPIIRRRVALMLGDRFNITEAATAERARAACRNGHEAIILDIVFPDGNGIDICKETKARDPYTTIVISSSLESVDAWNQAFQAGADGYLEKRELLGLDPRKIVLMIENLVERNRLRRQWEETSLRQAELLSVLSHDVRAPFQALLGAIELLKKSAIPPEAAERVNFLHGCAKDQLAFINSLLDLLRLESGSTGIRKRNVDINLPVNQSLQSLGILAEGKGISVAVDLAERLPAIEGDLAKIAQLAGNLISNAIKFTRRGGRLAVRTRCANRDARSGVELQVEDNGIGIRPEEREKVLQRFHRGRERGTEGETGTGLGLSICKEIAQLHGGKLEIVSAKPQGTIVTIWFPVPDHSGARKAVDASQGKSTAIPEYFSGQNKPYVTPPA